MRGLALVFSCFLLCLAPRVAMATDTRACDAAYEQAQTLRDQKKLVLAKAQLRICGSASCPAFMVKDCTGWLADVERRTPSIVLAGTDATGTALADVSASLDGAPPRPLDGTSLETDPGEHKAVFTRPDGSHAEKTFVVLEGQRDQRVTVEISAAVAPPVEAPAPSTPPEEATAAEKKPFPYRTLGYAALGVGGAAVVAGAILGGAALATKGSDCTGDACTSGGASTALAEGTGSTAAFVAGAILAAGGLTLVLLAPKQDSHAAALRASPLLGAGANGLLLSGSF